MPVRTWLVQDPGTTVAETVPLEFLTFRALSVESNQAAIYPVGGVPGAVPVGPYHNAERLDPLTCAGPRGCAFEPSQKNACSVQVEAVGKTVVAALNPVGQAKVRLPVLSWQILNTRYSPAAEDARVELVTLPVSVIAQELLVLLDAVNVGVALNVTDAYWPAWPIEDGKVAFAKLIAEGVPRLGVVSVGEFANTTFPEPVVAVLVTA